MKHLLACLLLSVTFLFFSPIPSALAQDEYPVAFWGQKHVQEAVLLHRSLSPSDFSTSCRTDRLSLFRRHRLPENLHKAWSDFSRSKKRLGYCQSQPKKTWYLLGEAPYFMLPENPGSHK